MRKKVLIIGAGKIGRGFIAHLFSRSGYGIWLLDAAEDIINRLNTEKKYRINLASEKEDVTEYIKIEGALTLAEVDKVAECLSDVEIIASSVGANNIEKVAAYIKNILTTANRKEILNWIICENANDPAKKIRNVLLENANSDLREFVNAKLGLVETQVLRTGMDAKPGILADEPLALRMQDWWSLPLDKDAWVGPIPEVTGSDPKGNFANQLLRKLYTFNGTNGPIAYVGWANGFSILHEAALAYPQFFKQIQEESAFGLIREFNLNENEQYAFMALAMKKYTDPALQDSIPRNASDTKRKLAKQERLLGPALLCLKHGRLPVAYAKAIAAAYFYNGSDDPGTVEVQETLRQEGIEVALQTYSSIDASSPLFNLVMEAYHSRSYILS